jgi:tetratricopeptide (TPR) repeat protein
MISRWSEWLGERMTSSRMVSRALVERQLGLILDVLASMVGPLRRETKPIWARVTEHYGRIAAVRGLAAGEVVEEMQYLREVLIRYLAPSIAALRPRQGMSLLLRLNRLVDRGVAMAVVGYTDALVHTLIPGDGSSGNGAPTVDPADFSLNFFLAHGSANAKPARLNDAVAFYRAALAIRPHDAAVYNNLGNALKDQQRLDEAEGHLNDAVRLRPDDDEAYLSRAMLWLLRGDFERGWPEYEWRWRMPGSRSRRCAAKPASSSG